MRRGRLIVIFLAALAIATVASVSGVALGRSGSAHDVRANALAWRVLSVHTARTIRNAYIPARAPGVFVIVHVREMNVTHRRVPVSSRQLVLKVGGNAYDENTTGDTALELSGHRPLPTGELGPTSSATGWVSFAVPVGTTAGTPRLCVEQSASQVCVAAALTAAT